jgi:predicted nucleic acid-binding protein
MFLVDSTVIIDLFRDRTGHVDSQYAEVVGDASVRITRMTQMEVLRGCRDAAEWEQADSYLASQVFAEIGVTTWVHAARIHYDLRRLGLTVRSSIDCLIAQTALDHDLILLHNDRDFEAIGQVRNLQHRCIRLPEV